MSFIMSSLTRGQQLEWLHDYFKENINKQQFYDMFRVAQINDAIEDESMRVYDEDELDEILDGTKPSDIIRLVFFGDVKSVNGHFCFDGYGNLVSKSDWELEDDAYNTYFDEVVEFVLDYPDEVLHLIDDYVLKEFLTTGEIPEY